MEELLRLDGSFVAIGRTARHDTEIAGSNLARQNLQVAIEILVDRLRDIRLQPGAEIRWHSEFNRSPLAVPIAFEPGPRRGA